MKKTKLSKAASLLLSLMLVLTLIPSAGAEMAFAEGETEASTAAEYVNILNKNGKENSTPVKLTYNGSSVWTGSEGQGKATFSNADGKSTLTLENYNYYPISAKSSGNNNATDITLVLSGSNTITGVDDGSGITALNSSNGQMIIKGDENDATDDSLAIDLTGLKSSRQYIYGIFAQKIVIDGVAVTINIKEAPRVRYALYATKGIEIKNGAKLMISFDGDCSTDYHEYAIYNEGGVYSSEGFNKAGDIVIDNSTVKVKTAKAGGYGTHYSISNENGSIKIAGGSKVELKGYPTSSISKLTGTAIDVKKGDATAEDQKYNVVINGSDTELKVQDFNYAIFDWVSDSESYGIELTGGAALNIENCYRGIRSKRGELIQNSKLTIQAANVAIDNDSSPKSLNVEGNSIVELKADGSSYALDGGNACASFDLSTGGSVTLKTKSNTKTNVLSGYFQLGDNTTLENESKYSFNKEDTPKWYLSEASSQPDEWSKDADGYYSIKFVPNKALTDISVAPNEGGSAGDTPTLAVPTTAKGTETMNFKATGTYNDNDSDKAVITESVDWSVTTTADGTTAPTGVSIDYTGKLTVEPNAKAGNVYVKAKSGDVSSSPFELILTKEVSTPSTIKLFRAEGEAAVEVGKEGGAYTDTIYIPTTNNATVNYSAKAYDQYGAEMSVEGFAWSDRKLYDSGNLETTSTHVTFNTGGQPGITVTKDADEVKATMTATVKDTDVSETLTVYVKNKKEVEITGVTAETNLVYNGTAQEGYTGTPTWSTADWNGTLVTTYYLKSGETKTSSDNSGAETEGGTPKYAGEYKVKFAIPEDEPSCKGSAELEFTIAQKEVSVDKGNYKVSKVYDGTNTFDAVNVSGTLNVSGILSADTGVNVTATPGAYPTSNAGTGTMSATIALNGEGSRNYKFAGDATEAIVPYEIEKASLKAEGAASATATYGTQVKDITISGLTAKLNETEVDGTWSFSSEDTPDVGTTAKYKASFAPITGADNYNELTMEITPSITKATYEGKTASGEAKYGASGKVDLSGYIVEGGTATVDSSVEEVDGVLGGAPSIDGKTLQFEFTDNSELAGKKATIKVKVTSKNYSDYYVTVTVTVLSKTANTLSVSDINAVYGDTEVKLNPSEAKGDVSYSVASGDDVISVAADGKITINKAGTAKVKVTAAGDDAYASKTVEVTVTIAKRKITVKANDKTMTVNGTLPSFDVTYGNLAAGDTKDTVIETEAVAGVADEVDGKTAGSFEITIKTQPEFKAGMTDKYEVEVQNGTLTVNAAAAGGGAIGGGGTLPLLTPEKPEITIDNTQGKLELSADGATASITANEGYEIEKVTVNGVDKGAVNKLTGLKTGDKVVVSFKSTAPAADDSAALETIKEKAARLQFMARSSKTSNKNVKLTLKLDSKTSAEINELRSLGYTVKYKFYRSTKKSKGYKAVLTKTSKTYTNTKGVKGTKYYYKARVQVFDKDGKLVAQTALKQCKYASRTWSK